MCPKLFYTATTNNVRVVTNVSVIKLHYLFRKKSLITRQSIHFKPFCTSHFASGIDHLLDNISYSIAVAIRRELYTLMGRNMYYRIRNKERLLHPCEQEQIAAIFLKHGIKTKPEFDQYIDKYDW